jgi:hypothetical protein
MRKLGAHDVKLFLASMHSSQSLNFHSWRQGLILISGMHTLENIIHYLLSVFFLQLCGPFSTRRHGYANNHWLITEQAHKTYTGRALGYATWGEKRIWQLEHILFDIPRAGQGEVQVPQSKSQR